MEALFNWVHSVLGMHFYTPLMLLSALGMVIFEVMHHYKQKKREKDFEDNYGKENA